MFNLAMLFFIMFLSCGACAQSPQIQKLKIIGVIDENLDVSAISCIDKSHCLLASDETNSLQSFKIIKDEFILQKTYSLGKFKKENDIEGLTNDGIYFYAIGSHGLSRKSGKYQKSRFIIFRLLIDQNGDLQEIKSADLSELLIKHSVLSPYFKIPLQQNGINIEGLAQLEDSLYIGFRAPVIAGKALILSLNKQALFEKQGSPRQFLDVQSMEVDLEGNGIRSLEIYQRKLFIIAGTSAPIDSNKALLYEYELSSLILNRKVQVPFDTLKLEGFEVLDQGATYLFIYDSEEDGMPVFSKF